MPQPICNNNLDISSIFSRPLSSTTRFGYPKRSTPRLSASRFSTTSDSILTFLSNINIVLNLDSWIGDWGGYHPLTTRYMYYALLCGGTWVPPPIRGRPVLLRRRRVPTPTPTKPVLLHGGTRGYMLSGSSFLIYVSQA